MPPTLSIPKVLLLPHPWEWMSEEEESGSGWSVEVLVPLDGQAACPAASLALGTLNELFLGPSQTHRCAEIVPEMLKRGGHFPEGGLMLTAGVGGGERWYR